MKRRKRLWDEFVSVENFRSAVKKSLKNKKKTGEIKRFLEDADALAERLRQSVIRGEFVTSQYRRKTIYEPKKREIYILPFYPDRIIHHALMNVLIPIFDPTFCRDSYACRPGLGIHSASRRVMQFVRRNKYFLQCDIRKFYPSINHGILYEIIARKVGDKKVLAVIADIIGSVDGERNLPIGNFCSQWFGNIYLNELDRFVKQTLRAPDYLRYCDDFCLFSDDKKQLAEWRAALGRFLSERLGLAFSYAEVAPVSAGMDFCGYRHFPKFVKLRKTTLARIRRRIRMIMRVPFGVRRQDDRICCQVGSMHGWLKRADHNIGDVMRLVR